MRVVTIVNGYTGGLCLQEVVDQGDEVVAVVTSPGDPRPGADPKTSVKLTADRNYLPVYQPPIGDVNSPKFVELLRKLEPDLIVSMHYAVIFREPLLRVPRLGCVNEHPSRLPAGQGMTPSYWHMIIGDERNWIALHYLDPGIDTGDIIAEGSVEITPDDTGATASRKLSEEGHRIFAESLPLIREGRAPRMTQKEYGRLHGIKRSYVSWKPTHAQVNWSKSAQMLALHVRTLTVPRGGSTWVGPAYTYLAGLKVSVRAARALEDNRWRPCEACPGEVLGWSGGGLLVATGEGILQISDADIEGCENQGMQGLLPYLATGLAIKLG
jgi:methionyl-tRNA formyltransferase